MKNKGGEAAVYYGAVSRVRPTIGCHGRNMPSRFSFMRSVRENGKFKGLAAQKGAKVSHNDRSDEQMRHKDERVGPQVPLQTLVRRGWAYRDTDSRRVGHWWRPSAVAYPYPKYVSLCNVLCAEEHLVFSPEEGFAETACPICAKKRWGDES